VDNSLQIGDERCMPGLALMRPTCRAAHLSRIFDSIPSRSIITDPTPLASRSGSGGLEVAPMFSVS